MKNREAGWKKAAKGREQAKLLRSHTRAEKTKEAEARDCLLNLFEVEQQAMAEDWAEDCRKGRLNWMGSPKKAEQKVVGCRTPRRPKQIRKPTTAGKVEQRSQTNASEHPNAKINGNNPVDWKCRAVVINKIMNEINRTRQQEGDISAELFRPLVTRRPLKQKRFLPLGFLDSSRMAKQPRPVQLEQLCMFYSTRYNRFPKRRSMTSRKQKPQHDSSPTPSKGTLQDLKQSLVRFQRIQSQRRTPSLQKYQLLRSKPNEHGVSGRRIPLV